VENRSWKPASLHHYTIVELRRPLMILASALFAGLDYSHSSCAVIPMLPNGTPGSRPKSLRNSVPIRNTAGLSDDVSEGLGRIRREMHNRWTVEHGRWAGD
jgi:hypothetical protein